MSNRLEDFFDEEYEKNQSNGDSNSNDNTDNTDTGYIEEHQDRHPYIPGQPYIASAPQKGKGVSNVMLCLVLVIGLVFGVLIGVLIGTGGTEEGILSGVLDTLRNDYYFDISDEEWEAIIASGGTALLQGADDYGMLLSPQDAYDLVYGVYDSSTTTDGLSFGFSYYNVGDTGAMVIASVVSDTNAFGRFFEDDIVLSLENIKGKNGSSVTDSNGEVITSINLATLDSTTAKELVLDIYEATFVLLRDGEVLEVHCAKGTVGSANNSQDNFSYVQYFFGENNTNVSTTVEAGRYVSTMQYKELDSLTDNGIGYIYISQFSTSADGLDTDEEFAIAMQKFAESGLGRLVVDVKGNPGGDVDIVSEIASMLSTDMLLDDSIATEYNIDNTNSKMLTVTMQDSDTNVISSTSKTSSYSQYFDMASSTIQIIIWTDGNSASASELLTGVLLDYGTGVQMGTTTYGKGIAQTVSPLYLYSDTVTQVDGTEGTFYWCVYYTFAKYYSPLGTNIHGVGYTPDSQYDGLEQYSDLVSAAISYWQ